MYWAHCGSRYWFLAEFPNENSAIMLYQKSTVLCGDSKWVRFGLFQDFWYQFHTHTYIYIYIYIFFFFTPCLSLYLRIYYSDLIQIFRTYPGLLRTTYGYFKIFLNLILKILEFFLKTLIANSVFALIDINFWQRIKDTNT